MHVSSKSMSWGHPPFLGCSSLLQGCLENIILFPKSHPKKVRITLGHQAGTKANNFRSPGYCLFYNTIRLQTLSFYSPVFPQIVGTCIGPGDCTAEEVTLRLFFGPVCDPEVYLMVSHLLNSTERCLELRWLEQTSKRQLH